MDIETFIATTPTGTSFDIGIVAGALANDHDIKTAVLISIFTDRRAEADDTLPNPGGSRRGWWGDALSPRRIGSRLWLLSREKQLREVANRAREYAEESLEWLVEEGIARRVEVSAEIIASGWLALSVSVSRETGATERYKFDYAWRGVNEVTH